MPFSLLALLHPITRQPGKARERLGAACGLGIGGSAARHAPLDAMGDHSNAEQVEDELEFGDYVSNSVSPLVGV